MMGAGKMLALNVGNSVTALKEKKRRGTYINLVHSVRHLENNSEKRYGRTVSCSHPVGGTTDSSAGQIILGVIMTSTFAAPCL